MLKLNLSLQPTGLVGSGIVAKYKPFIDYKWETFVSTEYKTDGVELVTNGGFDTDLSGWTLTQSSGTAEIIGGEAHIVSIDGSSNPTIEQDMGLKIGELYFYTITQRITTNNGVYKIGGVTLNLEGDGTFSGVVTAISSTSSIRGGYANREFYVDNISIQKVIQEPNKRYIKDKGISPKYPLALYGGQGVKFNGTNQYIDLGYYVTHTSTATISFNITITSATHLQYVILGTDRIVIHGSGASTYMQCDFRSAGGSADVAITNPLGLGTHNIVLVANNGTFTSYVDGVLNKTVTQPFSGMKHKYIGSREGSSSFLNETLKDLYIFNRALTPAEITKAYEYPEQFFIDVTNGTVTDCVLNMPMNEIAGSVYENYAIDYEGFSEGVETLDGTLVNIGCLANGTTYTAQASSNDRVQLEVDETLLGGTVTNKFILCKMLVANGTANSRLRLASNENSFTVHSEINGATDGWYYLLGYVESATSIYPLVYPDRVSPYDSSIDILEWSIKEISGIYPITNPTTDTRSLAKQLPYGLQSSLMITDDNGVITGKSSYLEGDGVSYADTGWIPSADEDVTVEMIISTSKEGIIDIHGTDADYGFNFGIYSEVTALVKCFGKLIHYQVNGDYIYLSCVYNGTTKKFIPYFNDYKSSEQAVVNTVSGTSSFTLGKRNQLNTPYPDSSPIRLFKVHNKALTQEEVTENYNKVYFDGLLAPDDAIRDENGKVIFDEDGNYILLGE